MNKNASRWFHYTDISMLPKRCTIFFQFISINSLYMFRALFAHLQEALYIQQLVYFLRVMSAGC
jgi:hypothetical protein